MKVTCRVPGSKCQVVLSRLRLLGAWCLVLLPVTPVRADVRDFVGRPLADVRVELAGVPFAEPSVLQLIETRVGEPLSMERVRETVDHLIGLGRFEDIRVFAERSPSRAEAIALRWMLVPVQRVGQLDITGRPAFDVRTLRAVITDRLGASPASSRVGEMIELLTAYYVDRGYRRPAIQPQLRPGRAPESVTLVLSIDSGPRTLIGNVSVTGDAGPPATVISELRLDRGRPYDRSAIESRLATFAQELRDLGYYEARVDAVPIFSEDGATANLTIDIERGPRVRVVFAGDPLPENRRDTLVPIRQERSVDLDLLEDASRNIEAFLRQQGYRAAEAPYVREAKAGEMILTFTVSRGALHRLASIDVSGNRAVPLSDLTPLMPLQPGEPFVDSRIATVAAAVTELYRVRGFARAVVKPDISVLASQTAEGRSYRPVVVRLIVTEGVQTTVGAVTVEGSVTLAETRTRPLLALTSGRPFYRPQLDADREAIERLYRNEGFQSVRVDAETTLRDEGTHLDLRWLIREGPQTTVDHILVSGNVRTSADLIRREIPLTPGQPLGDEGVIESQRRLAALGLFRRVRIIELPHGASASRDILVEVEEAPSTTVAYGGGLEAGRRARTGESGQAVDRVEVAPRAFFEIGRRNLWGKNRSINLFTRVSLRARDPAIDSTDPTDAGGYGFNEYRVLVTFREPRPFDSPGDLQLTGVLEQAIRSSFNFARRGVRAEYARRPSNTLTLSGRYALDRTRLFDEKIRPEDRLLIDRLFPDVRLSTLTGSLWRDSRNDLLDPERGTVVGIDGSLAARALGSEVGFVRSFTQAYAYRRLPGATRLTLAAGVRVGFSAGFERLVGRVDANKQPVLGPDGQQIVDLVDDVPASERFFAGGDSTVRGFVLDRLGTDDTLNDQGFPAGGEGLAVLNLELRTLYWKGLSGVGFLDAGNVFKRASDINFGELRHAAGFGVRYRSPLGPVRVDLGFNLDRRMLANGDKERGTVFHISLGQAF